VRTVQCNRWFHIDSQNISHSRYKKKELNEEECEVPDGLDWIFDGCRVVTEVIGPITMRICNIIEKKLEVVESVQRELKNE